MHSLIICGGTPPSKKLLTQEIENAQLSIGADSGGYVFLGLGFKPDLVIGDLDSFAYTNHEGVHVVKDPDQETNDLEKALNHVLEQGSTSCTVLGALGKRIDHTAKNLSVLYNYKSKFETLVFKDDYGDTFVVESPYNAELPIGTVISFFQINKPLHDFTSTGVLYPLTNASLEIGKQDGTSNEVTSEHIQVTFKGDFLGVFVGNGDKMNK